MPPLQPGSSDATVSGNIAEMMAAGHPQNQAVAASMGKAGRKKKKRKPSKSGGAHFGHVGAGASKKGY